MRQMRKRGEPQQCFGHDGLRIPWRQGLQGEVKASIRTIGIIEGKKRLAFQHPVIAAL